MLRFTSLLRRKFAVSSLCSLLAIAVPSLTYGGTYTWNAGSWGSFTGTGAGQPTAYTADDAIYGTSPGIVYGMTPSLTLISGSSSQNYTLGATYSYSVTWTPDGPDDTPPDSVTMTFNKLFTLSAFGTGEAKITSGSTTLAEMDSTNDWTAGFSSSIAQAQFTSDFELQSDGTYLATGSFTTDSLSSTWNSGSGGTTFTQESFAVNNLVGNFS
jgi:hypothetical protein